VTVLDPVAERNNQEGLSIGLIQEPRLEPTNPSLQIVGGQGTNRSNDCVDWTDSWSARFRILQCRAKFFEDI
jgi:hypothetical protein